MRCHSCNDLILEYNAVYMKKDCSFCSNECRSECRSECSNTNEFRKENYCSILFSKLKELFIQKKRTVNKTWSEIGL